MDNRQDATGIQRKDAKTPRRKAAKTQSGEIQIHKYRIAQTRRRRTLTTNGHELRERGVIRGRNAEYGMRQLNRIRCRKNNSIGRKKAQKAQKL
jgi:hypothetical protein